MTFSPLNRVFVGALAGALACALAAPAFAQDHPMFLPSRDVAVTYVLGGGEGQQTTHLFYDAASQRLRIDTPGNAGYTVLDRHNNQRIVVVTAQRIFVQTDLDPKLADGFVLNSSMQYQRGGPNSVVGLPCTEWTVRSQNVTGSACVTDDGVLLRGSGQQQGGPATSLTATDVQYAHQPDTLFGPPAGFRQVDAAQLQEAPPAQGNQPGSQ